jgi:MFS family permease
MSLLGIALSVVDSSAVFVAILILLGIAMLGAWLALQSLVTLHAPGRAFGGAMTSFSISWGIGVAVGPLLGAWTFARWGFGTLVLLVGILLSAGVAIGLIIRTGRPQGRPLERVRFSRDLIDLVRLPGLVPVLAAGFLVIFLLSIRGSFYPLYLMRADVPVPWIGFLLATMGVSSLLILPLLPRLVRRFGPVEVMVASLAFTILGMGLTPVAPHPVAGALAAGMMGIGFGANAPISVQLIGLQSRPDQRGLAVALRILSNRSAQVAQPLMFGWLAGLVGLGAAFPVTAGLLCVVMIPTAIRMRQGGF